MGVQGETSTARTHTRARAALSVYPQEHVCNSKGCPGGTAQLLPASTSVELFAFLPEFTDTTESLNSCPLPVQQTLKMRMASRLSTRRASRITMPLAIKTSAPVKHMFRPLSSRILLLCYSIISRLMREEINAFPHQSIAYAIGIPFFRIALLVLPLDCAFEPDL